jgi:hypothetical protein
MKDKKRSSAISNRIPLTFDQAIDVLLAVDPKKLPPVVRPGKSKAKKKAAKQRAAKKNG